MVLDVELLTRNDPEFKIPGVFSDQDDCVT